jgi:hypothetical protein
MLKHLCHMRKQFENRVRLVIYMDQRDLNALTARAKFKGRVLVDWAREVLFREISEVPVDPPVEFKPASRPRKDISMPTFTGAIDGPREHTAKSNRLTCMCDTCQAYRHDHEIPFRGFLKRAKNK